MRYRRLLCSLMLLLCAAPLYAVRYTLTFDATWSSETHPNAYPASAHFSPLVGTTHNSTVSFWGPGGPATQGVEDIAETGSTSVFAQEVQTAIDAGSAFQFIRSAGIGSPASLQVTFEVLPSHSQLTMLTMIAPSPDWFVGVSGLPLLQDGTWIEEMVIELMPYDAGTETGNRFSTSNEASDPHQSISRLDVDAESVLFESAPFGTFHIELQVDCDFNLDGRCDLQDLSTSGGLYGAGDLVAGVDVAPGVNSKYDLTADGQIDTADLELWLALAADHNGFSEPYLKGDTNLNDHVGFGDFNTLANHFGRGVEWSEGNYRGSGVTSFDDFALLAQNYGQQIGRQANLANVPEGQGVLPLLLGLCGVYCWARLRNHENKTTTAPGKRVSLEGFAFDHVRGVAFRRREMLRQDTASASP